MSSRGACVLSLGCRVNRVELDALAGALLRAGVELVDQVQARVIVVNTCAVTGEAEAKCRKAIRHAAALPQEPLVLATGCAVNLFADEFAALGERVAVEPDKARVVERALAELGMGEDGASVAELPRLGHVGAQVTPTGRMRPGIKVQDGCDNRCSYCIVWKARGPARSLPPEQVLEALAQAQADGAVEVVLTGINLARYEASWQGRTLRLDGLLDLILTRSDVARVRLSSVEPPETTREVLRVMGDSDGRVAPFLHLPLQSGCDRTLEQMGRAYDSALYRRVVEDARELVPQLALACDLIVGFPGETDDDFAQSLAFCEQMLFAKMHVFRYSERPGTPAAARSDQVPAPVKAARSQQMIELSRRMREQAARERLGAPALVFVERPGRGSDGGLFQVLVDEDVAPGNLLSVVPHAVTPELWLDARP